MVVQFQTSFIPKKSPIGTAPTFGPIGRNVNVFALIALIVFFLTAGLAAFVFFYKSHLTTLITTMDTDLARAKKSFEPSFIETASRLNVRIEGVRELLDAHTALSPLFDILEKKTLESVRFQDFNFSTTDRKVTLTMTGQAKSFNAVALQSDVFGAERAFKDPVFSNFTLNEAGDVIFNFQASIEPEFLLYRETVLGGATKKAAGGIQFLEEPAPASSP